MNRFYVSVVFILIGLCNTKGTILLDTIDRQQNAFYNDYSKVFNVKLYSLFKQNTLEVYHQDQKLVLSPNRATVLGLSFNYKFIGLSIGIGLPYSANSIEKYGTTKRFDMQLSYFWKNIGFDGYLQMYKGYYNKNPQDFMVWENDYFPKLPEMKTSSLGVSGYYVFNSSKYSNKASVSRTCVQKVSAGSFILGVFANYDDANAPNGFFPSELPDSIGNDFDMKGFRYFATGISLGYAYTWVISENIFIHGSIVPGGGYKNISVENNDGVTDVEGRVHGQALFRGAIGYENEMFYLGLTGSTLLRNIKYRDYDIDLATEQIRFFIGKRFK